MPEMTTFSTQPLFKSWNWKSNGDQIPCKPILNPNFNPNIRNETASTALPFSGFVKAKDEIRLPRFEEMQKEINEMKKEMDETKKILFQVKENMTRLLEVHKNMTHLLGMEPSSLYESHYIPET